MRRLPFLLSTLLFCAPVSAAPQAPARTLFEEGAAHLEAGRYAEAEKSFTDCLKLLEPKSVALADASFNLGLAQANQGRYEEASATFRKTIETDPGRADARLFLGTCLRVTGDWSGAVAQLVETLRLDPDNARAHDELWQAYAEFGAKYGYDEELVFRQYYHIERLLKADSGYEKRHPGIFRELKILTRIDFLLDQDGSRRVRRGQNEEEPTVVEEVEKGVPSAQIPALPDDGIPAEEKLMALVNAKRR